MQIAFPKQQNAITQEECSLHTVTVTDHNPPPLPANRFGAIGRLLRTAFRNKAPQNVEDAKLPIEIWLNENSQRGVLLEDLAISTSERLNNVGLCTFELGYTKENGLTCLTFIVNVIPGEIGARFSQLNLNVRLLDPGKCISRIIYPVVVCSEHIQADSHKAAKVALTTPSEPTTEASGDLLDNPGAKSISRNTTKITDEDYTWQSEQKRTISWTMNEKVGIGRGVSGRHTFRLWTGTSLPLNTEISVSAKYLKGGNTKDFEIPGKDKFLAYRLRINDFSR